MAGATWWICVALVTMRSGYSAPAGERDSWPAKDLFQDGLIPKLQIEVPKAGFEKLRQHPRTYVTATVREGDTVYTNVSIRLKGGPGSFRALDDKPSFTLNFDRLAESQKFHGLKKLHLNNSVQDPTYLAEKISRELFEAAGVPAPRAGHAGVELNGRHLGLYVLIEGINKQFLKRYFKDADGNLYDGHSQSDVTRKMPTNSGENPEDRKRLRDLAAAAQQPDLEKRLTQLEMSLDVDRFISFIATEVMLCHWDGYVMNRNNFRVFHDRQADRMVFLPQGADQVFQRSNNPASPSAVGLVAKSVLEVPQLRKRYRERMAELLTNVWQLPVLSNRVHEVRNTIEIHLAKTDPQLAGYRSRIVSFERRIQQRIKALERQLLIPTIEAQFDPMGVLSLTNWQPKIDLGSPALKKEEPDAQHTLLYIGSDTNFAASWRTRMLLDPGRYRFQGRVRLQGVEFNTQDQKSGAGVRISRQKFSRQLPGDSPWTTINFEFDVSEDRNEVELVCELRATRGEAWFDQNSLRLVRVK